MGILDNITRRPFLNNIQNTFGASQQIQPNFQLPQPVAPPQQQQQQQQQGQQGQGPGGVDIGMLMKIAAMFGGMG